MNKNLIKVIFSLSFLFSTFALTYAESTEDSATIVANCKAQIKEMNSSKQIGLNKEGFYEIVPNATEQTLVYTTDADQDSAEVDRIVSQVNNALKETYEKISAETKVPWKNVGQTAYKVFIANPKAEGWYKDSSDNWHQKQSQQ